MGPVLQWRLLQSSLQHSMAFEYFGFGLWISSAAVLSSSLVWIHELSCWFELLGWTPTRLQISLHIKELSENWKTSHDCSSSRTWLCITADTFWETTIWHPCLAPGQSFPIACDTLSRLFCSRFCFTGSLFWLREYGS